LREEAENAIMRFTSQEFAIYFIDPHNDSGTRLPYS